jgi:LPXTG-motif cell wall-anchored protein
MKILSPTLLLLLTVAAVGADEPNTLTPEEAADGWVLLFNSENPSGLRSRGQTVAEKTQLVVVGGAAPSRVGPQAPLPGNVELRLEFRTKGRIAPRVIFETERFMSRSMSSHSLPNVPEDSEDWHELRLVGVVDPETGARKLTRTVRIAGGADSTSSSTLGEGNLSIWLEAQPGNQLFLRNIKLKAEPATGWKPSTELLMVAGLAAALLLLAFGLFLWRRRRAAAVDIS